MEQNAALILVDVQNDFCPGGSLAVSRGDEVVPVLNRYVKEFADAGLPIIATRDWHPEHTRHFKEGGGLWPRHCVQGSEGGKFHPALAIDRGVTVVSKGQSPDSDSYSGFEARTNEGILLGEFLHARGVERLFIGGLATDYCVKHTVLDALRCGFKVVVLRDAIRGVNIQPNDSKQALDEMLRAGAEIRDAAAQ
jgi:nicotinamidase/pyrazinamidase